MAAQSGNKAHIESYIVERSGTPADAAVDSTNEHASWLHSENHYKSHEMMQIVLHFMILLFNRVGQSLRIVMNLFL